MSYTISEYLEKNGYKVGLDYIRVTPETLFTSNYIKELPYLFHSDMQFLTGHRRFYCDKDTIGIIANPLTEEYFLSLDKDLVHVVAKEFELLRKEPEDDNGAANSIEFLDKKLQKIWEQHTRYIRSEITQRQKQEKPLTRQRAVTEDKPPFKTIKDIIHRGGFVPDDYVELKDKMTIHCWDDTFIYTGGYQAKQIKLPKEELSAKSYIAQYQNRFIIGSTDTNEAILTCNYELAHEFENHGFKNIEPYKFRAVLDYSDIRFPNKAVQNKWVKHQDRQFIQNALIKKEKLKYIKLNYPQLKREALFEKDPDCNIEDIIRHLATKHVLQDRAIARRATRNLTTTYDEKRNQALAEVLREKRKTQKIGLRTIDIPEKQVIKPDLPALRQQMLQQHFNDHSRS